MSLIRNAFRVLFVLWTGSLWSLALWVAPTLFFEQGDRHLAGLLAAHLFRVETYLGLGVAAYALVLPGRGRLRWLYAGTTLLALNEWVIRPLMDSAHGHGAALGLSFGAWHGVSALAYVLACLCALLVVWNENLR